MASKRSELDLGQQLVDALQLMAADANVQEQALPDFVSKPDEVALGFLDAYLVANIHALPSGARARLRRIADAANRLPLESPPFSDPETLRGSEFRELREQAQAALDAFGIPRGTPRLSGIAFARGRPGPKLRG